MAALADVAVGAARGADALALCLLAQPKSGLAAASAHVDELSNAQSTGTTISLARPRARSDDILSLNRLSLRLHHSYSTAATLASDTIHGEPPLPPPPVSGGA